MSGHEREGLSRVLVLSLLYTQTQFKPHRIRHFVSFSPDDCSSSNSRSFASDELIEATEFEPNPEEPRLLHSTLKPERYPSTITEARLDIRWFETNDFTFHYVETQKDGETWECRWDRHPNQHNARTHFHKPPEASAVEDLDVPSLHPLEVYSIVLTAIEGRIEALWKTSTEEQSSPRETVGSIP
ncbi:MAG: hypothetical protein ABEJ84_02480 [Halodesulfurarchaeum sp.]